MVKTMDRGNVTIPNMEVSAESILKAENFR